MYIQTSQDTCPIWPPLPYMVKNIQNFIQQTTRINGHESWYVALGNAVQHQLFK